MGLLHCLENKGLRAANPEATSTLLTFPSKSFSPCGGKKSTRNVTECGTAGTWRVGLIGGGVQLMRGEPPQLPLLGSPGVRPAANHTPAYSSHSLPDTEDPSLEKIKNSSEQICNYDI